MPALRPTSVAIRHAQRTARCARPGSLGSEASPKADGAYAAQLLAGVLLLPLGLRLLWRTAHSGAAPERWLGLGCVCMGGSYFVFELSAASAPGSLAALLAAAARISLGVGCVGVAAFSARVFRSGEDWARHAPMGIGLLIGVAIAGSAFGGDWRGSHLDRPWFWIEWAGRSLPFLWVAVEGFAHYRVAQSRLRLGLSDPQLCQRYLLWGLFGVMQLCAALALLPVQARATLGNPSHSAMQILLGAFALLSAAMLWLVFFPPSFYRGWVTRAGERAVTAQELSVPELLSGSRFH